jgi:SAM-dependent methyltransferase
MERRESRDIWDANAPTWIELSRAGFDIYRDLVNTPAFLELLPDVAGLAGLDLGCGEGHNTRMVRRRGADVVALDLSEPFTTAAGTVERSDPLGIAYILGDGACLPFPNEVFDFVTAFMSLMDMSDPDTVLAEVGRVLRPTGFLQFSIGHPFTTTPIRRWVENPDGEREALAIGDYFYEGKFAEDWSFPGASSVQERAFRVVYTRRTLSTWLNTIIRAGFVIEALAEPHPDEQTTANHPLVADSSIAPYFLLVRASKADRFRMGA